MTTPLVWRVAEFVDEARDATLQSILSNKAGKQRTVQRVKGKSSPWRLRGHGKRRRKHNTSFRGEGLFENIQRWFVKHAIKVTPVANMQKGLQAVVYDPKTKTRQSVSWLPGRIWKEAGAKDRMLNKYYYPKSKWQA